MSRAERLARRAHRRALRRRLREEARAIRLAASLKRGRSLATHLIVAGVDDTEAIKGTARALNGVAKRLAIAPVKVARTHRTVKGHSERLHPSNHFTSAQVNVLMAAYKPRKAEFKAAIARLPKPF